MAQHSIIENIHRNTEDWFAVKAAVRGKGVDCPDDTPTADVAGKIEDIQSGVQYEAEYQIDSVHPEKLEKAAINISGERIVLNIPSNITTIKGWAFDGTMVLFDVELPDGITTLNNNAFASCYGLQNINLPNSITYIGEAAFSGCSNIENIELPTDIIRISESTFAGCYGLKNIIIPDNVMGIDTHAFEMCSALSYVVIPLSVTNVGTGAFASCTSLTDIYYKGTEAQWGEINGLENIPSGATIHYNYVPE